MNTTIAQQIANEGGVEAYLHAQQHKSLLRFLTCGSVDDGKSTLIGRLLHDTRQIYEDQLSSLHNDSKRHGTQGEKLDLALLVDKQVTFAALRDAAFAAERKLLKSVSLFDVYEGDKLPEGKKSYALSFILEDKTRTLDDKTIERVMSNLTRQFEQRCGAQVRA